MRANLRRFCHITFLTRLDYGEHVEPRRDRPLNRCTVVVGVAQQTAVHVLQSSSSSGSSTTNSSTSRSLLSVSRVRTNMIHGVFFLRSSLVRTCKFHPCRYASSSRAPSAPSRNTTTTLPRPCRGTTRTTSASPRTAGASKTSTRPCCALSRARCVMCKPKTRFIRTVMLAFFSACVPDSGLPWRDHTHPEVYMPPTRARWAKKRS